MKKSPYLEYTVDVVYQVTVRHVVYGKGEKDAVSFAIECGMDGKKRTQLLATHVVDKQVAPQEVTA